MQVVELWRYPVKSMQGERIATAAVDHRGIVGDRQWALRDTVTGATLTARRQPELLYAYAALLADGADGAEVDVRLPEGHTDLTAWLGHPVELVRPDAAQPARFEIALDFEAEDTAKWISWDGPPDTFHDSGRTVVSLLTATSMRDWDWRRFRANIITDGTGEADLVGKTIRIGTVEATVTKPISRCVLTTRPQPGGIARDLDVLRTVNAECGGNLGISLVITTPGEIHEGDTVEVIG